VWGKEPGRTEGLSSATLTLPVPGGSLPAALSAAGLLSERKLVLCRLIACKGLQRPHLPMEGDLATHQVSFAKKGRDRLLFSCNWLTCRTEEQEEDAALCPEQVSAHHLAAGES